MEKLDYTFNDNHTVVHDYHLNSIVGKINGLIDAVEGAEDSIEENAAGIVEEAASRESLEARVSTAETAIVNLGIKTIPSGNANNITVTGRYAVRSATNIDYPCYLEVFNTSPTFILQRATTNNGTEKKRVYNGTSWSPWA